MAGALVLALLGAAGVYAYYFSGLRSAPAPLTLATATPTAPGVGAPSPAAAGLAGDWKVGPGSEAGFRVGEVFAGQAARHEAVVRTSTVTGTLHCVLGAAGYALTGISVSVATTDLRSQDTVAGFNVASRDRIIQGQLATSQFPAATFTADAVTVPVAVDAGAVTVQVPGKLTIHGVTRDVTVSIQAQRNGDLVEAAGSIPVAMADYRVSPPQLPITAVEDHLTVEFKLELARA